MSLALRAHLAIPIDRTVTRRPSYGLRPTLLRWTSLADRVFFVIQAAPYLVLVPPTRNCIVKFHKRLFRLAHTSNNVCLKSLANVEVSCKIRFWSSRSFCHESSNFVFMPAIFVRPEFIRRSSSYSFIRDCISDILISDTLFSETSSVFVLLISKRASHSSSSKLPICWKELDQRSCYGQQRVQLTWRSNVVIFDLSSSSPLFIEALLILPLVLFFRSLIVFCAASSSCLNVSRSLLNRSHCLWKNYKVFTNPLKVEDSILNL